MIMPRQQLLLWRLTALASGVTVLSHDRRRRLRGRGFNRCDSGFDCSNRFPP
jgi:hypothetical protein